MTDHKSGSGHRVRRTVSFLVDTGRAGDVSWRWSRWTTLALIGPGSVPIAVLLFLIEFQMLNLVAWLAAILALLNPAAIVLSRFRPLLGWVLALFSFATILVLESPGASFAWPWTASGIFTLMVIQFAVARARGILAAVAVWSFELGLNAFVIFDRDFETARQNLILVSLLSLAAAAVGLAARAIGRARERVGEEERLTATERARREQLEDRARIARELHDVVAHHMSVISVQAATAEYRLPDLRADVREEFHSIGVQARQSLSEMRRLLGVLRTGDETAETEPQPGLDRLPTLIDSVRRAGIDATLTVDAPEPPPTAIALTAYRLVQEALSNVVRYAPGAETAVTLRTVGASLLVDVENEPPPVAPDASAIGGGFGLTGMRERVTLLGGQFTAEPTDQGGFAVHVTLPYEAGGQP